MKKKKWLIGQYFNNNIIGEYLCTSFNGWGYVNGISDDYTLYTGKGRNKRVIGEGDWIIIDTITRRLFRNLDYLEKYDGRKIYTIKRDK